MLCIKGWVGRLLPDNDFSEANRPYVGSLFCPHIYGEWQQLRLSYQPGKTQPHEFHFVPHGIQWKLFEKGLETICVWGLGLF